MVAIPDYSSGATEHWGLITFRETSIYYNANESSASNKQRVASVISHEMAHQWFGNLGKAMLQLNSDRYISIHSYFTHTCIHATFLYLSVYSYIVHSDISCIHTYTYAENYEYE